MEPDAYARLDALERSNRQLRTLLLVSGLVLPLLAALAFTSFGGIQRNSPIVADSLLVRQLVVTDSQGTVRARLGAHLPDALIDGKRLRRGADIAGILLYDDTGRERGGYVTFSPSRLVALTLDTRDRQVALFAADSDDGAAALDHDTKDRTPNVQRLAGGGGCVACRDGELRRLRSTVGYQLRQHPCRGRRGRAGEWSTRAHPHQRGRVGGGPGPLHLGKLCHHSQRRVGDQDLRSERRLPLGTECTRGQGRTRWRRHARARLRRTGRVGVPRRM